MTLRPRRPPGLAQQRELLLPLLIVAGACSIEERAFDERGTSVPGTTHLDGGAASLGATHLDGGAASLGATHLDESPPPAALPNDEASTPRRDATACDDPGFDSDARYVCPDGDDAASGTATRPWATYERARTFFGSDLRPGGTIAFCRGGVFAAGAERRWVNPRCTASEPCVIRDYGDPDRAPPIIESTSGSIFDFSDAGDPDHEEGYTVLNLRLEGRGAGVGVHVFNDVSDLSLCGLTINEFSIGVQVSSSNAPTTLSQRVVLRHSVVSNNSSVGFLGSGHAVGVEHSSFVNNGFGEGERGHHIHFDAHELSIGMFAVNNDLYQSARVDGRCVGVALVAHGNHDGLIVADNLVREDVGSAGPSCWGIAVDPGFGGESEAFTNVVIQNNDVENLGNVGIGLSACDACRVEGNRVVHAQPFEAVGLFAIPNKTLDADDGPDGTVAFRNNTATVESTGACFALGPTVVQSGVNGCHR